MRIGETSADLKHCGKIPDVREELNRSVREGRIKSMHFVKSLDGIGSRSHELGVELRMPSFTFNYDTYDYYYDYDYDYEEKVSVVIPATSNEVTCSEAMLAVNFSTSLLRCMKKSQGRSALGKMDGNILCECLFESVLTIWCCSLLENARANLYGIKPYLLAMELIRLVLVRNWSN